VRENNTSPGCTLPSAGSRSRSIVQFEAALETLDLTGLGESLMHPEIFEIIDWVRSRRLVHIYLTTNTIRLNVRSLRRRTDTLDPSADTAVAKAAARNHYQRRWIAAWSVLQSPG